MPFIPHTDAQIAQMLQEIGLTNLDQLFTEIPVELQVASIPGLEARKTEREVVQCLSPLAQQDSYRLNFIGAGSYEHYIPALIWDIATRGEFLTSYTPYQAEASQGTLQVLYEFQTMLASLTALDVANASLYDGASALAEAVLMAQRISKLPQRRVLIPRTVHPFYRQVVKTIVSPQQIEVVEIDFDLQTGKIDQNKLSDFTAGSFNALVIPQPNFFGVLEETDVLTNWAHEMGALVIGLVNPLSLALLKPPGQWGVNRADIACGEAQCLGVPLSSGGPYIGFLCCKREYIRQLPGRLAGMTHDLEGRRGFTLTLQAREQHIRRAKATSNICTNQGLLATVVTIYLSLLGYNGLKQIATQSHANTVKLKELLHATGIKTVFNQPFFHEIVVKLNKPVAEIQAKLAQHGIEAGFNLEEYYPKLANSILCCATETKTLADLEAYVREIAAC